MSLFEKLHVDVKIAQQIEEVYSKLLSDYRELVELLRKARLLELIELYEKYKNCSVEETWVLNKLKKKYYYYYLKCKDSNTSTSTSIYLGKSTHNFNLLKRMGERAVELKNIIDNTRVTLEVLGDYLKQYLTDLHILVNIVTEKK